MLLMLVRWIRRITRRWHHPQSVNTISYPLHRLYTPRRCRPRRPSLECPPYGSEPIYDRLRGERINADVPATGADPQLVGHP
ncbi:MAG: hypothetical protein QOJ06_1474, partial [Pseudonocardiales bacterium]|nr:hypothetical protein [Pseudonocardiales bacterium]